MLAGLRTRKATAAAPRQRARRAMAQAVQALQFRHVLGSGFNG